MRLLIVDPFGEALDFAMRCQRDGHDVRLGIKLDEKTKYIGKGLVSVTAEYQKWVRWADVVFMADNTLYTHDLDKWRQQGVKVVGSSIESAAWETNRSVGMKVFQKAGIATASCKEFKSFDDAIAYVKREDRRFVSKVLRQVSRGHDLHAAAVEEAGQADGAVRAAGVHRRSGDGRRRVVRPGRLFGRLV